MKNRYDDASISIIKGKSEIGGKNMGFINELITYVILVVGIGALALGGIFLGKFLRDKHDAKAE